LARPYNEEVRLEYEIRLRRVSWERLVIIVDAEDGDHATKEALRRAQYLDDWEPEFSDTEVVEWQCLK